MRTEFERMREALASYIEATYHLSNPKVVTLRRALLAGEGIAQTPYVESTPSYESGRPYKALNLPNGVASFLAALASKNEGLLFDPPYEHQAQALERTLREGAAGSGVVVTTGTGSGKTESFLLPVLARLADEAINRPSHFGTRAVRALLLYPMNALVNDQLGRLRNLFGAGAVRQAFTAAGGRPAKFGRYTGRTLYPGFRNGKRDQQRLKSLGYYLAIEEAARSGGLRERTLVETLRRKGRWPGKPDSVVGAYDGLRNWYGAPHQHWEDAAGHPLRANEHPDDPELLTRHEIQEACPDLLVTNYSMLEYMLLRPLEREIFAATRAYFAAHPDESFFLILDEAHLYRGANGTEVAYLVRRLLDRLGLSPSRVVFIATSASFSDAEKAKLFVSGLCGLEADAVVPLAGRKQAVRASGPGDADLAARLASIPLDALRSSSLAARSAVLAPLARGRGDLVGAKVTCRRIDGGPEPILVGLGGLDPRGERIEETLLVEPGGEAASEARFLILDAARAPDGKVEVARAYTLGTAGEVFSSEADDLPASLFEALASEPVVGRLRNITSGARSSADPVEVAGAALSLKDLPSLLFGDVPDAAAATDALLELASLAKPGPDRPPLLPARVHMLFRGLPGLWACLNPACTEISDDLRGGPTGRLYPEPRRACACGAQVLELHSCRSCGLSVARANIGAPAGAEHLWQDNGQGYAGDAGLVEPVHVCLEDPRPAAPGAVRPVHLDLATGKVNAGGAFVREAWLPPQLGTKLFATCPRCGADCGPTSFNGISDLQTKGEQPFQELISVQVLEQPPRPDSDAPLQGRKALVFSDGRQTASRLAGTLKTFSFRDSLRPLLLEGLARLRQPTFTPSLDDAPLAIALGGAAHGVRLRPTGAEDGRLDRAGRRALDLIGDPDAEVDDFRTLSSQTSEETPLSVYQSLYAVLQDDHTGLLPLALATLRPKLTKSEAAKLAARVAMPAMPDLSEEAARGALVELWLWQALRKHGVRLQHGPSNVEGARGSSGIRPWNGRFSRKVATLLEERGLKQWLKGDYANAVAPALRDVFAPGAVGDFYVLGSKVALDAGAGILWIRCERCTSVSPRNALIGDRCTSCLGRAHPINPASDPVFRSRKAFFRRLWERMADPTDGYVPHQLVAEEHSAALNDSGMVSAMSRNEAYELRFQDIPIEQDGQLGAPIDILSCTTTMEVGIDIGGLTAVALRNVPPGRANYQQRAGRAGRRGAGLSTVVTFCGADSHDQSHFRDPAPMVAGPAPDPILNLDNVVIARRQALGFLIGRFQQDRIDEVRGGSDVFSSLGSVADFVGGDADGFSLEGLRHWIAEGRAGLRNDVLRLFTNSCPALDADAVLDDLPKVLEEALVRPADEAPEAGGAPAVVDADNVADEIVEDAGDGEASVVDDGRLLDRLFALGLLPKYAFPTDVASFSVFEDGTDPWRPKRRYSPQQALNAALSEYAPGHEVWVDGKRFLSLGLYAERETERLDAYREKRLYFQCRACNYAHLVDWSDGHVDQTRDCPACQGRATLGPARRWVRPPGFSHPPGITALPADFDAGLRLRPTKATLDSMAFTPDSRIGGGEWPIGTGWEGWSESKNLVVTNRGSLSAINPAFNYCTQCGRIEPADFDPKFKQLSGGQPHDRPRPRRPQEPDQCTGKVTKIVLGNEFRTDVAVFRLTLPRAWQFDPDRPSTQIAARSAVEALRRAACHLKDLEPNDIDGDFRFAPGSGDRQFIDLYLYDQAAGGAGFVKAAARDPEGLVEAAITLLDGCTCDDSCYQCLRSYKNRFDHATFDRFVGSDLLKACFAGWSLDINPRREDEALDRLARDLEDSGAPTTRVAGGLIDQRGRAICLSHPFVDLVPCSKRARALASDRDAVAVDVLMVLRALPIATGTALGGPAATQATVLAPDPAGVPEVTAAMVAAGLPAGDAAEPRYAVSGAEDGDLLFRIAGNMLTAKNGDGQGGTVPKGSLALFRPFAGTPARTDLYLVRRTDGKAFGATGAGWTVGIVQPASDGTRIRYRAASQHMECVSEVVMPAEAVEVLARFVKVVA